MVAQRANKSSMPAMYRIVPGLGLLSAGKRSLGLFYLLATAAFLALFVARFDLVVISFRSMAAGLTLLFLSRTDLSQIFTPETLEFWIAALFLLVVPFLLLRFSVRSYHKALRENDESQSGEASLWQLGMISFKRNGISVAASMVIFVLYSVAFLAPLLSPFSPYDQQDFLVTAYQPPLTRLDALVLRQQRTVVIPLRPGSDMTSRAANTLILDSQKLRARNLTHSLKFVNSYRVEGSEVFYRQGMREKSIPLADLVNVSGSSAKPEYAVTKTFLLGTDQYGRDIFSRVLYGSRISLSIGFLVVLISVSLGTVIGISSGYFGGWIDNTLMRIVDVLIAFPALFLILIIIATFGNSIYLIVITLSFTGWMGVARIVRGQVLSLKEQEFILAARSLGLSNGRIIFRHLLPNTLTPVIVAATLRIGSIILTEAGLSFLGLGVQPPTPSWGNIINEGRDSLLNHWWISTFPGVAILSTVVCFNLIGDGIRDALDPRMRG
ncbi:ABC transporter permease [Chlorobaculum limnaeum]|uniref:ABC transporter permease n=1 Tax=Chlorobaculum limnaeum TaxID=274537 RepID=A0A1D8CZW9_CHLLM|nr:ABC transporter permease [Chlorobaculum limnaeum]AOS83373.1 ABC transporter permease [Chlorobaculum limnaeum]